MLVTNAEHLVITSYALYGIGKSYYSFGNIQGACSMKITLPSVNSKLHITHTVEVFY